MFNVKSDELVIISPKGEELYGKVHFANFSECTVMPPDRDNRGPGLPEYHASNA